MKKNLTFLTLIMFSVVLLTGCATKPVVKEVVLPAKPKITIYDKAKELEDAAKEKKLAFQVPAGTRIESVKIDTAAKTVEINFDRNFSYMPFRDSSVTEIYNNIKNFFGQEFKDYKYNIRTLGFPIEELVPNYYRKSPSQYDESRLPKKKVSRPAPLVTDVSKSYKPTNGLQDRNIVVWPSHGWYYNNKIDRWEWQRPRLFQTVEDKLPLSFTIPFLYPMLENAGAIVFDPRERDPQQYSVVVDNDSPRDVKNKFYVEKSKGKKYRWVKGNGAGFEVGSLPYPSDFNPFTKGTFKIVSSDKSASASVSWIPDIPETGCYAVYVSYSASDTNVSDAKYFVYHDGVKTEFKVNQQIGGNTWVYLGEFRFEKGYHPKTDKVELQNISNESGKYVSADAVRFGGGRGVIERGGSASGRLKLYEGARYYLQYAGMPDSLVYDLNNGKDDYRDDYQSRPEFVNYLYGKPFGPNRDRDAKGLGIPIDLSMAFHTDAGVTHNDTTVGTFVTYSIKDAHLKTDFPDGMSRLANRDLADIVQTQIVNDIRAKYDPAWNRRALEDAGYSEARNPNVPSLLVELLSHQNYLDMKFAQDPQFRFDVARAMYKGMLRFLSVQNKFKYVVEPLPVKDFTSELKSGGEVYLSWKPVEDPLEPTAKTDSYIVYTRKGNGDFDNGTPVSYPYAEFSNLRPGEIYSYKVTAVNKGGESFPSEVLSVCNMGNGKPAVLIVNGFDRVSSPSTVESSGYVGFNNEKDRGVPDGYDISYTGRQYNYDSTSDWKTNDDPGWGASYANYEDKVIAGNTHDYPYVHGETLRSNGYSFVSTSVRSVIDGEVDMGKYKMVDIILGEQRKTHQVRREEEVKKGIEYKTMPESLQAEIKKYCEGGGKVFISGAYVGSDLFNDRPVDTSDVSFARNVLKYTLDTYNGGKDGEVYSSDGDFMRKYSGFRYNTKLNDSIYAVENADAIDGVNGGEVILRYKEDEFPAATGYRDKYGVVVFGFPFETIDGETARSEVMKAVLKYLGVEK